jgi:2-dehydropantoate 2-reductase
MKLCVYGAGAIGGTLAVRLAQAGHQVSVIARGAHLEAIRRDGLTLLAGGERHTVRLPAADSGTAFGPQDAVLVGVKAHGLATAAQGIAPLIGPHTAVVPMVNGVPWWFFDGWGGARAGTRLDSCDPDGRIAQAIPAESVLGGVVYFAADSPAPGVVRHNSGNRVILGEPSQRPSARAEALAAAITAAGLDGKASTAIRREIFLKLWGNVCFNPVSVLTGSTTDRMIDDARLHALFMAMMEEVVAVANALGLGITMTAHERIAQARRLGGIRSSMLQDVEAGRAIELDAIVGSVVEIAEKLQVPVPFVSAVFGAVRVKARALGLYPPA